MTNNCRKFLGAIPSQAFQGTQAGKFAPKLTREERCAVLALVRNGMKRDVISKIFEIDKRTVAHIVNESGPHYRDIRKEYRDEGNGSFSVKYLTPEIMKRVGEHMGEALQHAQREADAPKSSSYSAKMKGMHAVQPEQCHYVHQVEIAYLRRESLEKADGTKYPEWDGWYYRDTTSEDKDTWYHNGPDSVQNSKVCFDMMVANLMDD